MDREKKKEKQLKKMIDRIARKLCHNDYNRGVPFNGFQERAEYAAEIEPIVRRLDVEGKPHLHIPRLAFTEYLRECLTDTDGEKEWAVVSGLY